VRAGAFWMGSVSHTIGQLALATGDATAAKHHLRIALEKHRRLGLAPFAEATEPLLRQAEQ